MRRDIVGKATGSLLLSAGILVGCASCTATTNARLLARETLAQSTEYEDSVRGVLRGVTQYYEKTLPDLEERVAIQRATELGSRTNRLADDAVAGIIFRGFRPRDFRTFIDESVAAETDAAAGAAAAIQQMRQRQKALLDQLGAQEKNLKTLRTRLETLQSEATLNDVLTELQPFFETARDSYEKTKKKK